MSSTQPDLNGDSRLVLAAASRVYELPPERRDQYIQGCLGLNPDGYWQLLSSLLDDPVTAVWVPDTVRDLVECRAVA
ncbi:DUF3263 domain-containing protein [Streptomyces sp. NPDC054865]